MTIQYFISVIFSRYETLILVPAALVLLISVSRLGNAAEPDPWTPAGCDDAEVALKAFLEGEGREAA